ncbi:MAG: tRNA (N(6)-L-threonylcarbamoyladenosine(37)-C(2))-methylthiotransferase MtaB [bacterium JZ-2024 1]
MKVYFHTLGCKVNYADTQGMAALFQQKGFEISENVDEADVVVMNTCAVTETAEKEVRQILRRLRTRAPGAFFVLTGCCVHLPSAKDLQQDVQVVIGNREKPKSVELVLQALQKTGTNPRLVEVKPGREERTFPILPEGDYPARTRRFLKIQDGCSRFCTFCIVPYVRGKERSLPPDEVLRILNRWAEEEVPEVVLVGIHLAAYGWDLKPRTSLAELVGKISERNFPFRVRLSSLEPQDLREDLIEAVSEGYPFICPHFHLPLQSGSDNVLRRMKRGYTVGDYCGKVERIRQCIPDVEISTDIIVGFPGETERDFHETLKTVETLDFVRVHAFPYSPRPGTPASEWPPVPVEEKKMRQKTLLHLVRKMWEKKARRSIGRKFEVIAETAFSGLPGSYEGYTENYFPALVPAKGKGEKVQALCVGFVDHHLIMERRGS